MPSSPPSLPDSLTGRLAAVRGAIAASAAACGRPVDSVTLVAIAKNHPAASVEEALAAGQTVFGENRVQEAMAKYGPLRHRFPDLELHLVGPLQTNKVREAVALFDVIETVDRPKLAGALADEMTRSGRRPGCFIQVNTGEEAQKAGVMPADADAFIAACRDTWGLPVLGLMCIPPVDDEPALHFALLADMARRNGLPALSMGMSDDYPTAVRYGATHVRVGTAIFGTRPYPSEP
jgi:pyridoxal phosphate enzyme (YggS family)